MTRVKRGTKAKQRRKKILNAAKGYYGGRHRLFKTAKETVHRALTFSYRDRKRNKRNFRKLWIIRINAITRTFGLTYNKFIYKIKQANININRKILADMAIHDIDGFKKIIKSIL